MSEVQRPIPAPRRTKQQKVKDQVDNARSSYENVKLIPKEPAEIYENVQILNNSKKPLVEICEDIRNANTNETPVEQSPPRPAPRKKVSIPNNDEDNKQKNDVPDVPKKSTGAIRKAPTVPTVVHNHLNEQKIRRDLTEDDNHNFSESIRDRSNSIQSSNSGFSGDSSTLYKTSSPKELFKSLGATSKLLSDSITERAKHKIDKNIRKSRERVESWTLEKKKTAQKKFKKLNLLKSNKKIDVEDNSTRISMPVTVDLFKDIKFSSPLNTKTNNIEDLSRLSMYEVPKLHKRIKEPLPTYEDVVEEKRANNENWDRLEFKRNDLITKSMGMLSTTKKSNLTSSPLSLVRIKSESNILDIIESESSNANTSSVDSLPCPSYPPPELPLEGVYGKIKKLNRDYSDESDEEIVTLRNKIQDCSLTTRGTYDIRENMSLPSSNVSKWSYIDQSALDNDSSSPEPIYVNNQEAQPTYEKLSEMETNLLKPVFGNISRMSSDSRDLSSIVEPDFEVVQEFDPLMEVVKNGPDGLNLIEKLLKGDTYTNNSLIRDVSDVESIDSENVPTPPERFDSLPTTENESIKTPPLPLVMLRKGKKSSNDNKKPSVIIHQNMQLRSDSVENIFDEAQVEQYLAIVEETITQDEPVDLRRPQKKLKEKTVWHDINESTSKFEKAININPINESSINTEKVNKSILPLSIPEELPPYDEATAPAEALSPPSTSTSFKNKFVNLLGGIKRRPSIKNQKNEVKTVIEMIPRPPLNEKYVSHRGHLLKLPSGALEDLMKELSPRYVELRDQKFVTFQDQHMTQTKETFPLKFVTSIQTVISNKFNSESGVELHCFEINMAIPKAQNQALSNSNMVLTSSNNVTTKTQKSSFIYGVHRKTEKSLVMRKILEAFIDKFPENYTSEVTRAGWCYIKVGKNIITAKLYN